VKIGKTELMANLFEANFKIHKREEFYTLASKSSAYLHIYTETGRWMFSNEDCSKIFMNGYNFHELFSLLKIEIDGLNLATIPKSKILWFKGMSLTD